MTALSSDKRAARLAVASLAAGWLAWCYHLQSHHLASSKAMG